MALGLRLKSHVSIYEAFLYSSYFLAPHLSVSSGTLLAPPPCNLGPLQIARWTLCFLSCLTLSTMPATVLSIQQRLTSTSSLLLERSRILSLNLPASASSQAQITRNLNTIKSDLARLADEARLESGGLSVGGGSASRARGKGKLKGKEEEIDELQRRYDDLLDMLSEDKVGAELARGLRRAQTPSTSDADSPDQKSHSGIPPLSSGESSLKPLATDPLSGPVGRSSPPLSNASDDLDERHIPSFSIEPPTPSAPRRDPMDVRPFKDYDEEEELEGRGNGSASPSSREMLQDQQEMMDDQDERLNLLSHSIGRQKDLSMQIGSELDIHHDLLEDTDAAMDRTAARLGKARRRLDKVADDAKQYGSTITIVVLIFILLILIIVFKT